MINYVKHSEIDKQLWDDCIAKAPNGIIYAYSWYLDVICPAGWDGLVDGPYQSVMPVVRGSKYLMNYIYPPFFAQQLGVFSKNEITEEIFQRFFNAIPGTFRFIEMMLHISNKWTPTGFSANARPDLMLNMNRPYEELRKNYSENHLRNIRKAERLDLSIAENMPVSVLIEMFRANRGKLVNNLRDTHYNILENLVLEASKRNACKLFMVLDENGTPVSGAVFFESHNTGILIFSAVTPQGRQISAMHFLIDHYIRRFSLELGKLDFEGSVNPELARFYRGFGSTEFLYLHIKRNQLPLPWKWFKN